MAFGRPTIQLDSYYTVQIKVKNIWMQRFFLFAIVFLFTACSSKVIKNEIHTAPINISNHPAWLEKPELDNHLAVVASAMPQTMGGLEGQRRAALLRARAELAKDVRVYVSKSFNVEKNSQQEQATVQQNLNIRATELQQLEGAKINAEWISPENSELFIWYVIPLK